MDRRISRDERRLDDLLQVQHEHNEALQREPNVAIRAVMVQNQQNLLRAFRREQELAIELSRIQRDQAAVAQDVERNNGDMQRNREAIEQNRADIQVGRGEFINLVRLLGFSPLFYRYIVVLGTSWTVLHSLNEGLYARITGVLVRSLPNNPLLLVALPMRSLSPVILRALHSETTGMILRYSPLFPSAVMANFFVDQFVSKISMYMPNADDMYDANQPIADQRLVGNNARRRFISAILPLVLKFAMGATLSHTTEYMREHQMVAWNPSGDNPVHLPAINSDIFRNMASSIVTQSVLTTTNRLGMQVYDWVHPLIHHVLDAVTRPSQMGYRDLHRQPHLEVSERIAGGFEHLFLTIPLILFTVRLLQKAQEEASRLAGVDLRRHRNRRIILLMAITEVIILLILHNLYLNEEAMYPPDAEATWEEFERPQIWHDNIVDTAYQGALGAVLPFPVNDIMYSLTTNLFQADGLLAHIIPAAFGNITAGTVDSVESGAGAEVLGAVQMANFLAPFQ